MKLTSVSVLELVWKYSVESHTRIGTDFYILYRLWSLCNLSFYYSCDLHRLWVSTCSTKLPLLFHYGCLYSSLQSFPIVMASVSINNAQVCPVYQEGVDSIFRIVNLVDKWINHEGLCSKKWRSSALKYFVMYYRNRRVKECVKDTRYIKQCRMIAFLMHLYSLLFVGTFSYIWALTIEPSILCFGNPPWSYSAHLYSVIHYPVIKDLLVAIKALEAQSKA